MNKNKLNRIIRYKGLEIIETHNGIIDWKDLSTKIKAYFFANLAKEKVAIPSDRKIVHELSLLEEEGAIEKNQERSMIYYKLRCWGHILLGPWYKKWGYFILFKNTNLVSIIALVISVMTLILSIKRII